MIILDVEQGTQPWADARCGILTASQMGRVVTAKQLRPSAQGEDYLWTLVAESLLGQPLDDEWAGSYWTERGHALEPQARAWLALHADLDVESVGLIYRDERRDVACSPDGLTWAWQSKDAMESEWTGGIELKCPMLKTHLRWLAEHRRTGEMPAEHRMQVQGSLWITGLPRWHFVSYHPPLEDGRSLPQLHVAVEPEPAVQAALDEHVPAFLERLREAKESLG